MTTQSADYELPGAQNGAAEPLPAPTVSAPVPATGTPRPTTTSFSVALKRCFWTESPRGTYEVMVSLTCEPDRQHTTAANLDIVHRLLRSRLDAYLDGQEPSPTPNGGA